MFTVVLLRHGESTWNQENRFTGWTDVDLSEKGLAEAREAGVLLRDAGFVFDVAYTSVLKRAIRTLWIAHDELDLLWIPVVKHWRLNERHYGALQGLNKAETAAKHGEDQVRSGAAASICLPRHSQPTTRDIPNQIRATRDCSRRAPGDRVSEGYGRPVPALLEQTIVPDIRRGAPRAHCRSWEQPAERW